MWSISWWRWSFRSPHGNVGQFSNTSFVKPVVRWEVHGTDFPTLLANQILVTSKITLPVTVSIRDFLPLLTDRNENNVHCHFIMKLNVNNSDAHAKKWHLQWWNCGRKPAKNLRILPCSSKATDSILTNHSLRSLSFNLFIYSFTRIKYWLHWWNNYIFFFYLVNFQEFQGILGGDEWCYRR